MTELRVLISAGISTPLQKFREFKPKPKPTSLAPSLAKPYFELLWRKRRDIWRYTCRHTRSYLGLLFLKSFKLFSLLKEGAIDLIKDLID